LDEILQGYDAVAEEFHALSSNHIASTTLIWLRLKVEVDVTPATFSLV
jgi:hypothetical protein